MLVTTTVEHRTHAATGGLGGAMLADPLASGGVYYGDHIAAQPLLMPDEVRRLSAERSILFVAGRLDPPVRR